MTWEFVACYGHHCEAFSDSCCVNAKPTPSVITGHHRTSPVVWGLTTGCSRSSPVIAGCHVVAGESSRRTQLPATRTHEGAA